MPAAVRLQQMGNLSGGELQRVLLARALLNDLALLVLDEPARGVEYVGEAELYALIGRLRDTTQSRRCCSSRTTCTSSWRKAIASSASTITSAAPACPRRWRSIRILRACSARKPRARSALYHHHHHDHRHDLAGEPA